VAGKNASAGAATPASISLSPISTLDNSITQPAADLFPDREKIAEFIHQVGVDQIVAIPDLDDLPEGWPEDRNTAAFPVTDVDEAVDDVAALNAAGINVYWSANQTIPGLGKKASKSEIAAARVLYVDVDPVAGESDLHDNVMKVSALEAERERIRGLLANYSPKPSLTIFSGGGYQAVWVLNQAIPIDGDISKAAEYERFNRALESDFGADNCHNVDRVLRLPGTVNWPNAKKRAKGRTPTLAELVEVSDRCYPISTFAQAPPKTSTKSYNITLEIGDRVPPARLREIVPDADLRLRIVDGPAPGADRSGAVWRAACDLQRLDTPEPTIAAIISDPAYGISEHVLSQGDPDRAINRAIGGAREVVAGERAEREAFEEFISEMTPTGSPAPADTYGEDIFDFLGDDEDDEDDAENYLINGLIPEGVPMVIAGLPKSRKSWIMYVAAIALASGKRLFGRDVRQSRVLIIGREDTRRETRRRIWRLARGMGLDPRDLKGWLRVDVSRPLRLDQAADLAALTATVADYRPGVVFIDCLARVHTKNENSSTEMAAVTNAWADLCSASGATVAIIHHMSKWGEGSLFQRMRGSGDLGAVVRFGIGVKKQDESISMLETDGNLPGGAEPFGVEFADAENADGKPIVTIQARGAKELRQDAHTGAVARAKGRVMDELSAGPASANGLCRAVGGRRGVVLAAIDELTKEGTIFRSTDDKIYPRTSARNV
jgi:hypothetical protein